ncbi:Card1-like endonuclease domain-containing protein [Belliella kenyensis]|uniref:Card1-like endonuclease domain-containing protein n=1 Tax=Belliella kenyensis TaxID=1472724 RepID=A0ABV8ES28_9BACT|nr:DUF1887 family CARF protein [Belliella kenyensis]MCH7402133.1 DUF1887 family CARF protein [Belliella kenyensis]MDN3601648.1 DUF1887 family CARF protein [Belliella kenyensis]
MPHLVSIISDQAVPNLLFIKQFTQPDSHFYFISSQEMEEKQATRNLKAALKLPEKKCHTIIIDANDALLVFDQLKGHAFPSDAEYLINLTGGNKLMSQMVFQHFMDFDSKMLYAPINAFNYQQLFPEVISIPKNTKIKLTLNEYLYAYGFEIMSEVPYFEGTPKPSVLFQKVLNASEAGRVPEIAKTYNPEYKEPDRNYLQGNWFEFYCYHFFKQLFQLDDSQISNSVGLKKIGSPVAYEHDNEFDIMFVHNNDLHVFECKVYKNAIYKKEKFQEPMYKLASLTQKFGLKCKKYLAILASLPEKTVTEEQLDHLRSNLGINKIITLEDFKIHRNEAILNQRPIEYLSFHDKINVLKEKFNSKN